MKKGTATLLSASAIGSATAASICCLGPLVLAMMGLGGGALLLKFAPYRPFFLGITMLFLGGAFYLTYRPAPSDDCEAGSDCRHPVSRKKQKIALWIVTIVVALAAAFPYLADLFL